MSETENTESAGEPTNGQGDLIEITVAGKSIKVPAIIDGVPFLDVVNSQAGKAAAAARAEASQRGKAAQSALERQLAELKEERDRLAAEKQQAEEATLSEQERVKRALERDRQKYESETRALQQVAEKATNDYRQYRIETDLRAAMGGFELIPASQDELPVLLRQRFPIELRQDELFLFFGRVRRDSPGVVQQDPLQCAILSDVQVANLPGKILAGKWRQPQCNFVRLADYLHVVWPARHIHNHGHDM